MVKDTNKHIWLILRIAVLVAAMFQARSFVSHLNGDFSKANWVTFFVLIAVVALGVFFVISLQAANPFAPRQWRRPSWFSNPFVLGQPLVIFDFAAYYFLVLGVVSAILGTAVSPPNWAWEIPLSVGVGAWIGVRLCLAAFRERLGDGD